MEKVYALQYESYYDTFGGDQYATVTMGLYATRELAEEARLKYYGYCSVVEMEVQTKVTEPEGYWDWGDDEDENFGVDEDPYPYEEESYGYEDRNYQRIYSE